MLGLSNRAVSPLRTLGATPVWRYHPDLNRGIKVLQTFALPLGHGTETEILLYTLKIYKCKFLRFRRRFPFPATKRNCFHCNLSQLSCEERLCKSERLFKYSIVKHFCQTVFQQSIIKIYAFYIKF